MTKLTCTLTVTVTEDTLERWQPNQFHPEPALEAIRSEIESWLDGLRDDGILISEYELAIRETNDEHPDLSPDGRVRSQRWSH